MQHHRSAEMDSSPGHGPSSASLIEAISSRIKQDGYLETAVPGLVLHRSDQPTAKTSYILGPSICLIGQGAKRVFLGDEVYFYDAHRFLLTSVDLPLTAQIVEASADAPYLGVTLALDLPAITVLALSSPILLDNNDPDRLGIAVSEASAQLLDAVRRLIELHSSPHDVPVMAPLIKQEIYYRLLTGGQGARLMKIASSEGGSRQIARAIEWLRAHYNEKLAMEELAAKAGLSISAFHSHFKAVTAMSPLQFQKKMQLSEARRMMFMEHIDASAAAFRVGYESPSQFSREYSRLFGAPPKRDMKSLGVVVD